jgi:polynucleotide 5'-hydroxyl-kinase GRC3/NOL9
VQKKITSSEVLLVRGPASVRLTNGYASCLGVNMSEDKPILVRKGKVLPFECNDRECEFWLILGEGSKAEVQSSLEGVGTSIWKEVADEIRKRRPNCIMLIGGNDSGKSTLTTYLSNICYDCYSNVWVVDGDLGQTDLAPPGCLGASKLNEKITDLRDLRACIFSFIGLTSPYKAMNLVIKEMTKLAKKCKEKGADVVIINTDGFVKGEGSSYKIKMAKDVKPSMIVCVRSDEESKMLTEKFREYNNWEVIEIIKPKGVGKDHNERVERRLLQYRRFLRNLKKVSVNLKHVNFYFLGSTYVSSSSSNYNIIAKAKNTMLNITNERVDFIMQRPNSKEVRVSLNALKRMFVGLGEINDEIKVKGFGVIEKVTKDFQATLVVTTNEFDTIMLSAIKLTQELNDEKLIPFISQK